MIAETNFPVKSLKGNLGKEYYARMQYGKVVIQRPLNVISHLLRRRKKCAKSSVKSTQESIDKCSVMLKQVWNLIPRLFFMHQIGLSSASGIGVVTGKAGNNTVFYP